jgi:hypothetical protein
MARRETLEEEVLKRRSDRATLWKLLEYEERFRADLAQEGREIPPSPLARFRTRGSCRFDLFCPRCGGLATGYTSLRRARRWGEIHASSRRPGCSWEVYQWDIRRFLANEGRGDTHGHVVAQDGIEGLLPRVRPSARAERKERR